MTAVTTDADTGTILHLAALGSGSLTSVVEENFVTQLDNIKYWCSN